MTANRRLHPRLFDYDYLVLTSLRDTLRPLLADCTGTVVDFGCGGKPYRTLCTRADKYVGVDLEVSDPEDLKLPSDGRIPMPDGAADAVVSFQVLEHVDDVPKYLAECARILRPGGRLVLTTHGTWPYHPMKGLCEDYWRWTAHGLRRAIEPHGFERLTLQSVCDGWRGKWQLFEVSLGGAFPLRQPFRFARQLLCVTLNGLCDVLGSSTRAARTGPGNADGPTPPSKSLPVCYAVQAWKRGA